MIRPQRVPAADALQPPGLTLVGVGPGDPELITVAAQRAIEAAAVVAYPVASAGAEGMAARIADPWIAPGQRRLPLLFPMVVEAEPRRLAWHAAADALAAEVAAAFPAGGVFSGDRSDFDAALAAGPGRDLLDAAVKRAATNAVAAEAHFQKMWPPAGGM